ncbi:MAG: sugar kinase [Proteobacteria bacterium]|nr:sugar kinase [Pseudomonadota bacterium]
MSGQVPDIPAAGQRRWDCIALGEVMLRLDPGVGRIRNARSFDVHEGGGEYNVARGLSATFGRDTAILTALPRNELGVLAESLMRAGGVDTSAIVWRDADPIGRDVRMGLNFTERGFGLRAALGVSDRARSAASQLRPDSFDLAALCAATRWLHTGGIFSALSESTAETAIAAIAAARRAGAATSYDLNYRASLWQAHPRPDAARRANTGIVAECDVLIADELSMAACLDLDLSDIQARTSPVDTAALDAAAARAFERFPRLRIIACPVRDAVSATRNVWGGVLHMRGQRHATVVREIEIFDRVGGGDAFVAGLIHGLLDGSDPRRALELAVAHGALAMTTAGDNAVVTKEEVEAAVRGDRVAARR